MADVPVPATIPPPADTATLAAYEAARADQAIDRVERALGGRAAIVDALLAVPPSARLEYVVGLIADPRYDARKLSAICRAGRVTVGELLEAFKRGRLARAQAEAIHAVAAEIPAIAADLTRRAVTHYVVCLTCQGTGVIPGPSDDQPPVPCGACRGLGQQLAEPDLAVQKEVLGLVGLGSAASRGPAVVIDQRDQRAITLHDHSPTAHGRLLQVVDRLLYGRAAAADPADPAVPAYTADASAVVDAEPDDDTHDETRAEADDVAGERVDDAGPA